MRLRLTGLLACGIVVASSACSMEATAPSGSAPSVAAARPATAWSPGAAESESGTWSATSANGKTVTYVVTIDPQRQQTLHVGAYTLELPANAICDESSGYGLDVFDLDCKAEKNPVTITAIVQATAKGTPRIDLMPAMRFSPKRVVTLSLFVGDASMSQSSPRLLYCPSLATSDCVDEAQLDPSLATQVDTVSGVVFRRIKHFSGYMVDS